LALAAAGAAQLYLGWFFFNGSSALAANNVAVAAVLATQIGATMCCALYVIFSTFYHKKPSVIALLNGLIAGLAGITPASGYVTAIGAIGVGAVLGLTFWASIGLKRVLRIDDALDVSVVHGLTGVIGSLANGFVASQDVNPDSQNGVFYGGSALFIAWQALAVLVAAVWAAVWTLIILTILKCLKPVRVSFDDEAAGIDLSDHGEFACKL
jgi:Amt family ammonium transporter